MRAYSEKCLRNLQDRMIVFGFEGWDIFIVLGSRFDPANHKGE
jgi:hypothetical protein